MTLTPLFLQAQSKTQLQPRPAIFVEPLAFILILNLNSTMCLLNFIVYGTNLFYFVSSRKIKIK